MSLLAQATQVPAEQAAILTAAQQATQTAKVMPSASSAVTESKRYAYLYQKLDGALSVLSVYTGTSVELTEDQELPANSSPWAPPKVTEGRVVYFDGHGWFTGPDPATLKLTDLQAVLLKDLADTFQSQLDDLVAGYTAAERQSWAQQLADAKTVLSGGAASSLLTALAVARGLDIKVLAQKIVDKDTAYQSQYATLLANYQKQRDAVQAAIAINQLPAISLAAFNKLHV